MKTTNIRISHNSHPSPLVGEVRRGGNTRIASVVVPPTPNPSPQGGGESQRLAETQP